MKTQAMVPNPNKKDCLLVTLPSLIVTVIGVYILCYHTEVYALSWTATPTLQAQEIYSDNIQLRSNNKQSAFVTSVNPGISITGQSPRSNVNFSYRLQTLYNAGGNNGLNIFNQLQSNSRTTFIPNKLFLNSNTSISQQNINNNLIGASNVNGSGNSSNVYTFGLSPSWTPRFGNYANGALRVNFNTIATDAGSSSNNGLNTLSDSVNLAETISLNSGSYFERVNWNLAFNNNENYRVNSPSVKFQTSNARVGIPINSYFNVFAQGGYSKNDFQSTTGSNNSGFFWTAGGQWRPSQRFNVTAGAGNNSFVSVYISPIQRLNWTTSYSDNSVGTNLGQFSGGGSGFNSGGNFGQNSGINSGGGNFGQSSGINSGGNFGQGSGINGGGSFGQGSGINSGGGNFGKSWQTALNYQTRRSTWSITRINNTTTAQQILAQNQGFPVQNQPGNPDLNPRITNNPSFTDDVIVTKTWNFSVSFNTGKSTLSANAFDQNYKSQNNGNNQKIIGVSGTWNWQLASKTSSYIRPQWQHNDNQGSANNSQFYTVAIGVNHTITSQLNGILEFRHANQTSSGNTVNFLPGNGFSDGYEENRVTASLFMRF